MRCFIPGFPRLMLLSVALLVSTGCSTKEGGRSKEPKAPPADKKADAGQKDPHDHPHEGPHEGALAEWGEEKYHAEFTVDHDKKQATVYILGGSAKKAAPIPADSITLTISNVKPPVQITLKADPDRSDPKGSSSRFLGTHEKLGVEMEFKGEISGKVGDTPYTGSFEEKEHKDHKHEKKKK